MAAGLAFSCDGGNESDANSTTDEGAPSSARVNWIDVIASDYTLELVPEFDREVTEYEAIAIGPDIEVWTDVIVNADVEGVRVNGVEAQLAGFRLWRSDPSTGLVSPTVAVVEVVDGGEVVQRFEIDVVVDENARP